MIVLNWTVQLWQCGERVADDPLSSSDDYLKCFPVCSSATGKPHTAAVSQHNFHSAAIEGFTDSCFSWGVWENTASAGPSSAWSRWGPPWCDTQDLEVTHPLHRVLADEQGLNVSFVPFLIHFNLSGLCCIENQMLHHWHSFSTSSRYNELPPPRDEPDYAGIICKLYDAITNVRRAAVMCVQGDEQRAKHTALR